MTSSQRSGRARKACGAMTTSGTPMYRLPSQAPISPMSWYSGSQLTNTSRGVASIACAIARMLASRLACVSTTPLGLPVLPEVYWMNAMSSRYRPAFGQRHQDRGTGVVQQGGVAAAAG